MTVRIVRLGTERDSEEGLRIGTVRRPPRGVPKSEFASQNWYDVWFPNLAPSQELMKLGQAAKTDREWGIFVKKYRAEMADPDRSRALDLLAALSPRRLSENSNFKNYATLCSMLFKVSILHVVVKISEFELSDSLLGRTSRWAATARTSRAAIDRCSASCW
jgi:uncharacterized protein YeaO (DUF488 family)